MKTAKLVMIVTLLVFTTVSITNADGFKEKRPKNKVIYVTLVQALGVPGLAATMLQQLDDEFLGCGCQAYYTQSVTQNNLIYKVTATGPEWSAFLNWGGIKIGVVNADEGIEPKGDL